jgi:hypothetical protein
LISSGQVDPWGKSEEELKRALILALKASSDANKINLLVDHRTSLLQQAREFARRGEGEFAILFYATWFEHWIKALVNVRGHVFGLTSKEIKLCLRQTGMDAKFVCFPLLLKFPRVAASHITTVRECSDLRNGFVHYKFPISSEEEDERIKKVITASEKTVRYLCKYERLHVFKRSKKRVRKLV